jgi:hypothetical protein
MLSRLQQIVQPSCASAFFEGHSHTAQQPLTFTPVTVLPT